MGYVNIEKQINELRNRNSAIKMNINSIYGSNPIVGANNLLFYEYRKNLELIQSLIKIMERKRKIDLLIQF